TKGQLAAIGGPKATAETIGKDKVFFGFAFQHFGFNTLDGVDLNRIQSVFEHDPTTPDPNIKKDIITTSNQVSLQINQSISFFTYGLTDRLDISVALPIVSASLTARSDATIQRIGTGADDTIHYFLDSNGNRTNVSSFTDSGTATGLGDILVRAKGNVYKGQNLSLALGLDLRMPTGDPLDFLGSGSYGVKPFLAVSLRNRRIAPHVNVGYQWNGDSVLAGDVRTGQKARLPRQLSYAFGVDAGINKKFSLAFDLLGQQIFSSERLKTTTFTAANGARFAQTAFYTGDVNANSFAAGFKLNPISTLLVSFNAILPINDVGLHARVIPLVGVSYTF
ncbi:MAG: transporter, partial [Bryobacteraceae bacterium]